LTKKDFLLLAIVALLALAIYAFIQLRGQDRSAASAVVSVNGQTVRRIDLLQAVAEPPQEYTVQGPLGPTVIQVRQGEARIISSPCPDKICVHMGWQRIPGQSAICLPNQVILRIEGPASPIDAVVR